MAIPVNKTVGFLAVNVSLIWGSPALAAIQSEVSVGVIEEWIDNVYYSSFDRRHDLSTEVYLDLNMNSVGEASQFELGYRVSHENYMRDSYDNVNYMQGNGALSMQLLPRRLFWNTDVNSSVTLRDSISPDSPDNRDQRHFVSTGLDYTLISSRTNSVTASATVSATRFREADTNNNNRKSAEIAWNHVFSPLVNGGLTCSGEEADFVDSDVYYETVRCQVNASRRLRNGLVAVDLGKRTINPNRGDTLDGLSYSVDFSIEEGRHRYSLNSYRDLSDTSVGLSDQDFVGGGNLPTDVNTDVLALTVRKRTEFGYSYTLTASSDIGLLLYRDSDDIYDSNLDTDREGLDLTFSRMTPADIRASVTYSFVRTEYAFATPSESVDYLNIYELGLSKRFSPHFDVSGVLSAEVRNGETDFQDYEAYSIRVDAAYTF